MEPSNRNPEIRFATRAVYPYFDSRRTGVFRFEAFLEAAIDCRYSSFRFSFLFLRRPLCSLFPCPVHVPPEARRSFVVKSGRGRRAIFPKRDSSKLMIPRKEIKSAEVCSMCEYMCVQYIYIEERMCASGITVKKSKLDLTISRVQQICSGSLIRVIYCYIPEESKRN